ncbi:hypothetical protein Ocin01_15865 [Orchesella cincta]|uniref:Uncharacterized protein n=1 Tax=Orchesella cincta TaxID=48709 RepID=A0A1D2MCU3_ORCCI|nr:hypothetical protein Ocin01_15865 [Orchesella cincta]
MTSSLLDAVGCLSCRTCMDDMPYIVKPNKNGYSAETYVGNWYEETCRNTTKRDEFLRKRECGDLKIQRTQTMIDLLLKPTPLTPDHDVQEHPFKRGHCRLGHLALSASVPPSSIDHAPYLSTDSIISASPLLFPVVRNSFVIEHPTCPVPSGIGRAPVNYGDVFRIRALPTQHFKLYLFSAPAIRLHCASTHAAKPKVRFSDIASTDTLWSAWPIDEFEKLKLELGLPVPVCFILSTTGLESTSPRSPTFQSHLLRGGVGGDRGHQAGSSSSSHLPKHLLRRRSKKEEAKKEAEGAYDVDDDDDYEYQQQMQVRPYQFDPKSFRNSLREMDKSKDMGGGQILHDPRTSPQPNAYAYKVFQGQPILSQSEVELWRYGLLQSTSTTSV